MRVKNSQVVYIDHMGSDKTIVNAARVSFSNDDFNKEFTEKDEKLIAYLAKHNHWSPFAHNSIQFKITAPIFIARQLVKHQVGGVWNEVSRRYVSHEPEMYDIGLLRGKPVNAKQGSSGVLPNQEELKKDMLALYEHALSLYDSLLERGVCPEQARIILPLGSMTDWYWTGSLMFWARVCRQRLDSHAQEESQVIAELISQECKKLFPVSWEALMKLPSSSQ